MSPQLSVYLLSILKCVHGGAERGAALLEYSITDWARGWAVALQAGLAVRPEGDALLLEAAVCRAADEARWRADAARHAHHTHRVVFGKEALAARVSEAAMSITRAAVETQNAERKRFMEHLRRAGAAAAAAHAAWTALVDAHTHEQGVWHDPRSYPQSWQLDPTEGAGRVRVRLRRAHLRMHPRFLKPAHRHKAEAALRPPPLHSILEGAGAGAGAGGARGGVVARLQLHETVAHMARAVCVTVAHDAPGELLLTDRSIHFVPDECPSPSGAGRAAGGQRAAGATQWWAGAAQSWPLERVVRVETRRWCLQEVAVELFLSSGHAHLVAFSTTADRTAFLKALQHCHLPNKQEPDSLSEAMSQWRNGTITNWEYLMRVNGLGGRSYNDLMQYPVLPFILADYTSRILDLDRPQSFRDLSRPVAVQNKAREQHYINTYNDLKLARREGSSPLVWAQAHHYAALYSNSGGVLHYLVRLPPFTQLFLDYQDNNFDMPDRTFHSLATTWRLITQDSHTDVKELIPELFYLPELFRNNEGLNFGTRQCGAPVDCVELPAWAADARLFVLAHRQALEARAVTEALPAWIDLVFGYKQTGQAAIDAINVFPACTYYGFDPCALEDAGDRAAAADMVRTYGQAPRRLLAAPHPHVARALPLLLPDAEQMSVCSGVQGARWGRYCGSPALGAPVVVARRVCAGAAGVAAPPHARALVALGGNTLLLLLHGEQAGGGGGAAPLGVVSWGHSDDIVRLKRRRDAAHDLLLHTPALDQITKVSAACLSSPSPHPVFIGHVSGRVQAVRVRVGGGGGGAGAGAEALAPRVRTQLLLAHSHPITDICVCAPAALLCTASCDGRIVLWDLNSLTYIRTLPNRERLPVTLVTISATLADVASVHDTTAPAPAPAPGRAQEGVGPGSEGQQGDAADDYEKDAAHKYKSLIRVHTCNAVFVGSVKVCERVCSVCYSHAAEGVSVNSLAAGLDSGGVRLYSSWDLRPTLYVPPADRAPLVSLRYSSDCSLLLGCYRGGVVAAWEAASGARPPSVRILPAHALL